MSEYNSKWDIRFMRITKEVRTWSKDPSTKIGAIIVRDKRILCTGYNGLPQGLEDSEERLNNRELKYQCVVHAEMNVLYNALSNNIDINGGTLYVYGLPVCSECSKGIIQARISKIFQCVPEANNTPKWKESNVISKTFFDEVNIPVIDFPEELLD